MAPFPAAWYWKGLSVQSSRGRFRTTSSAIAKHNTDMTVSLDMYFRREGRMCSAGPGALTVTGNTFVGRVGVPRPLENSALANCPKKITPATKDIATRNTSMAVTPSKFPGTRSCRLLHPPINTAIRNCAPTSGARTNIDASVISRKSPINTGVSMRTVKGRSRTYSNTTAGVRLAYRARWIELLVQGVASCPPHCDPSSPRASVLPPQSRQRVHH